MGAHHPSSLHARTMVATRVLADVRRRFSGARALVGDALAPSTATAILEQIVACADLKQWPVDSGTLSAGIDVYVVMASGIYEYDRVSRLLYSVSRKDIRARMASLDDGAQAPMHLVYVGRTGHGGRISANDAMVLSAINAVTLCDAVHRFCMAKRLLTAVRSWLDSQTLARSIGLPQDRQILLVQSIGYPAGSA